MSFLDTYSEMMLLRGLQPHTLKSYLTYIRAFLNYAEQVLQKSPENIDWNECRDFVRYLKNNRDKVTKFLRAVNKGVRFVSEHTSEEIAEAVAPSFADTSKEVLTSAIANYKRIGAYVDSMQLKEEDFDRLQDIIIEAGVMTKKASYADLVDNSYIS